MTRPDERTQSEAASTRRTRELRTIAVMVHMYCRAHHGSQGASLCPACSELHDYARRRLDRCVFGDAKPTCANCSVHCYKAAMRERVRQAMAWAGPRMLWLHPVLAVRHLIDGRRPTPTLMERDSASPRTRPAAAIRPVR